MAIFLGILCIFGNFEHFVDFGTIFSLFPVFLGIFAFFQNLHFSRHFFQNGRQIQEGRKNHVLAYKSESVKWINTKLHMDMHGINTMFHT